MKKVYGIILTKQLGANLIECKFAAGEALDDLREPESDMFLIGAPERKRKKENGRRMSDDHCGAGTAK